MGSGGTLDEFLSDEKNMSFVALRLSENKFAFAAWHGIDSRTTGRGGTDMGLRLFNTTHLD
jgi:hypothetical protein